MLVYLGLVVWLWWGYRRDPDTGSLRRVARLLPDLVRLLRRLAADPSLPHGLRVRLVPLIAYLVSPIDLIPDFVPVIGCLDDAVIVAIALHSVIRHAGPQALEQHWPGTPDGLCAVQRLAGYRPSD